MNMNPALSTLKYYFPVERAGYVIRREKLGENKKDREQNME